MSFFDKGVDGGLEAGSPNSSGDATPRGKTPIDQVFSRNGRPTPNFQSSQPGSNAVRHGDGGASLRLNLRQIWEDANRPAQQHQQHQQQQTSTIPHVVLPNSSNRSNYGSTITHRIMAVPHAQARGANAGPDVRDWDAGLERLRLEEPMLPHVQTSGDEPKCWPGSAYSYGAYYNSARPELASTAQSTAETASQPRHYSFWSRYGARSAPDNNSSARDGGITPTLGQYSAYTTAPRPARADAVPNRPLGARSEFGFNASTESSWAQRPCSSQPIPPIPIRMGQSPGSAPNNRTSSGPDPRQPPVPFYLQPPRSQRFFPMHSLGNSRETFPSSSSSSASSAPASMAAYAPSISIAKPVPSTRFSDRYHGMHTESNASAEHLAPEQNASLWITNLPPDATHHELLGQIRHIGRIWCCFINGPDGCKHMTAAAKVVFFHPSAARRLLQHAAAADGGLHIRGFRAKVAQNRVKTGETVPRAGDDSRVLIVTGDDSFVNEATLTEWFARLFVFQVDEVRPLVRDEREGLAAVEFRFGSYRCQAQMGKISLEKERPPGFDRAEFGEDPCEVGETNSSLAIASRRIEDLSCARRAARKRMALEGYEWQRSYRQ